MVKYIENTLMLIANESERLQVIKFSEKQELTITVLLLVLVSDLALQSTAVQGDNRAYYFYDLLYKLSVNVSGVQKYLKQIPIEQFCEMRTENDILCVFQARATFEVFHMFTSVYFKVIQNLTCVPKLFGLMLGLWQQTLAKHQLQVQKDQSKKILFGRAQLRQMLQSSFNLVHLLSKSTDKNESQLLAKNFISMVQTMTDLVLPSQKHQAHFTDWNDEDSSTIAYSTNILYWLGVVCMADAPFRVVGVQTCKRILDDSEFYKSVLQGQPSTPSTFTQMKLPTLGRSFLSVLFDCVSNKKVSEDVFKVLIVTIKASDSLLHGDGDKLPQEEFHRFLLLLPYLLSQFTKADQQSVNQSLSAFSNKRSIV